MIGPRRCCDMEHGLRSKPLFETIPTNWFTTSTVKFQTPQTCCGCHVVLCRKKQDGGSIKSSVQFPVSGLNITGHELQYDLVGTIHHKQCGIDRFHYTSICQTQGKRKGVPIL